MPVHKPKGSPYWHYDFTIDGLRFRASTKAKTRRAAEQIESRERDRILLGEPGRRPMLLTEAFERYTQEVAKFTATADATDAQLDRLLADLDANTFLHAITDSALAERIARRRGERARRKKTLVSNATVNRETELLRRVLRRADKVWKVRVTMPDWKQHLLPEPKERARELSQAEEARLLEHLRPDMHPLIRFCCITGARLTAAIRLTWADVDFGAGALRLRLKTRRPEPEIHAVPLIPALTVLLANEKGNHPIYVFTYECRRNRGKRKKGVRYPYSKNGWRKDWKAALAAAKIEDFRFHDTRHTAGSRLTRARGIAVTQKLLGHADIATTKRYAHVEMDDVRAGLEAVEDARPRQDSVKVENAGERKA